MTFLEILNTLLLKPLELIFEIIYMLTYDITFNPGVSIIVLSVVMNLLLLPLYNRADKIQEEERLAERKLHSGVEHIRNTFRGDEKMMMLQTYYRQNHYKPTYVLRGAVSLCLEIPFFMAAYAFLSNLALLQGVSFGPIADLGKSDALIVIAGVSINCLPILMTVINIISSLLYTKDSTIREKIQLYLMALVFLVLLYNSPAGLVLYWTMNNIFALVKTIILQSKFANKILIFLSSLMGVIIIGKAIFFSPLMTVKGKIFLVLAGIICQFPLCYKYFKNKIDISHYEIKSNRKLFIVGGIFLTLLSGILIPSSVITSSPQEFVDMELFFHPLWYLCSSFCLAFGVFIIWTGMFYSFTKEKGKLLFEFVITVFSAISIIDYMFFSKNLGMLSPSLKYEKGFELPVLEQLLNLLIILIVVAIIVVCFIKWKKNIYQIMFVACLTTVCMSAFNIFNIHKSIGNIRSDESGLQSVLPKFQLSKSKQNVIVIMMDKAYGGYMPYLINEKPELKDMFDGFTYYSNTISFGGHTVFGSPALLGGYEYTPIEMNRRSDESLVSKHNEALKLMPTLFSQNGFDVTVADPPYANHQWIPDFSIYDDIPDIKTYVTTGKFLDVETKEQVIKNNKRNFFCYGIFKMLPSCMQRTLYRDGTYRQAKTIDMKVAGQNIFNKYQSEGMATDFMASYNVLSALPSITVTDDNLSGQFLFFCNNATHDPMMLQEPEYVPADIVDNTEYEKNHEDRFVLNNRELIMETDRQYTYYQSNMASMLKLGEWFDYLRKEDVYDNTRIIIVADHGYNFAHFKELMIDGVEDLSSYYPLLMMKDFNASGFYISDELMTNGDVPTLATRDIIDNPVNPFTGKKINSNAKEEKELFIIGRHEAELSTNTGNVFEPSIWFSVHDNIWDKENWAVVEENAILP